MSRCKQLEATFPPPPMRRCGKADLLQETHHHLNPGLSKPAVQLFAMKNVTLLSQPQVFRLVLHVTSSPAPRARGFCSALVVVSGIPGTLWRMRLFFFAGVYTAICVDMISVLKNIRTFEHANTQVDMLCGARVCVLDWFREKTIHLLCPYTRT